MWGLDRLGPAVCFSESLAQSASSITALRLSAAPKPIRPASSFRHGQRTCSEGENLISANLLCKICRVTTTRGLPGDWRHLQQEHLAI